MTHPITTPQRHCHYCRELITTAFYLPAPIRGWACPSCYFEAHLPENRPQIVMGTEGSISAALELVGVA